MFTFDKSLVGELIFGEIEGISRKLNQRMKFVIKKTTVTYRWSA